MTELDWSDFRSELNPEALSRSIAADSSPQNKAREFAVLKTASFLIFAPAPGKAAAILNKNKESLLAAFTSMEELNKWPFPRNEVEEASFTQLQLLVEENPRLEGIVIDPFGKSLVLRRGHLADIDATLAAACPQRELQLRPTRDYPVGLPLAVRELCAKHPEVYRAWLLAARAPGDPRDYKLLVVDLDGDGKTLFPQLAKALRLYLRQGERLELRKADIGLLRIAEQATRPLYEKP